MSRTSILPIAVLLAGGCDWRKFDDLADSAWARSTGSPGDLNAGEWGVGLAHGGGAGDGVTFVGAGQRPDGVGTIVFDAGGNHSGAGGLASESGAANLDPMSGRAPMAGDPDQGAVVLGLSAGSDSSGQIIVFDTVGPGLITSYSISGAGVDALAVGAANNPQQTAGTLDLAVVTQNELTLIGDYIETSSSSRSQDTCLLARDRGYAAAIGELHSGSAEGEIVVGMGNQNQDGAGGQVLVIAGSTVTAAAAAGVPCVDNAITFELATITAPGAEGSFGDTIVIADLDGSGQMDLAIGAPSANLVYVWIDVDLASGPPGAPTHTLAGPTGAGRFGSALVAGDLDGDGAADLVVGDSDADVDGKSNAGRAWIIPADGGFTTMHELGDAQPEGEQHYGRALAVGAFGGGTVDVLAVAAHNEVFTYFRTPLSETDVRE